MLSTLLAHPIARKRVSEITPAQFASYRDERLEKVSSISLKLKLAPIHHLFEIARDEWGLPIQNNPLSKIHFKVEQQRRERRLHRGEFDKLIKAARLSKNPFITPVIQLAVETGMRRGEILSIKQHHIDWRTRALLIPESKNGQSRTIPLSKNAVAVLGSCGQAHGPLFPITANAFRLAWERVKQRANINDLHFHDLRHEAISRFFERGLTTPEVALISGHKDIRMLLRYSHAIRETVLHKLDWGEIK